MSNSSPLLGNSRGGSFLIFHPTPAAQGCVLFDVLLNPANSYRSTNGPICGRGSVQSTIDNRYQSYVAELGLNVLMGNGPLYGLRGQPDVPPNIEVKWSKRGDKLIVSKRHLEPGLRYVLASGLGEIVYAGWAYGADIVTPWMEHAFFMDRSQLRSMESLTVESNRPHRKSHPV